MDNVFIERLWRSMKYEDIYLKGSADGARPTRHRRLIAFTSAHHNTHLSMLLKGKGFSDRDAIPWGAVGYAAHAGRLPELRWRPEGCGQHVSKLSIAPYPCPSRLRSGADDVR
jgi:hypothetical protein